MSLSHLLYEYRKMLMDNKEKTDRLNSYFGPLWSFLRDKHNCQELFERRTECQAELNSPGLSTDLE